jgi:hypothetical protein
VQLAGNTAAFFILQYKNSRRQLAQRGGTLLNKGFQFVFGDSQVRFALPQCILRLGLFGNVTDETPAVGEFTLLPKPVSVKADVLYRSTPAAKI